MKNTYLNSIQKHYLRSRIIPRGCNVIGLAGPDTKSYIDFFKDKGYKNISIWENDRDTIIKQLPQIINRNIQYNIGDIINAPVHSNTFYDLDFCCTMDSVEEHVKKFNNMNFILTVSEMRKNRHSSVNTFFRIKNENVIKQFDISENEHLIFTNKCKYMVYKYCDTSPMTVIKSIN